MKTDRIDEFGVGVYNYSDCVKASRVHPGSEVIPVEKVPMFIALGFDDNGIYDQKGNAAVYWIRDYLKDKINNSSGDQSSTFDQSPARATFYNTAHYGMKTVYWDHREVKAGWRRLYEEGHEIGNHGTMHVGYWDEDKEHITFNGRAYTKEEWLEKEIDPCHALLTQPCDLQQDKSVGIGIPEKQLYGWRTPRLEWNNELLSALCERGYIYDCSMVSDSGDDGANHLWPFTLDYGHPCDSSVGRFPGLWELPCYNYALPPGLRGKAGASSIPGLDYNVWTHKKYGGAEFTSPEFTEILKYNLDQRIHGNRAPMLVGLHADIYSDIKNKDYPRSGTARERQLAIENFIAYAIGTYPEVRIVRAVDVISWMRNPAALGG
ncbi:chitin deacetylase [Chitinispirillum alkaliphilum]|nr:chitin deacetylase [Chitinispirillum alkaliphilum]